EEPARGRLGGQGPLRLSGRGEEAARAGQAEGAQGQGEGEGELTWCVKSAARNPKQGIVSCFGFRASDFSAPRPLAAPRRGCHNGAVTLSTSARWPHAAGDC